MNEALFPEPVHLAHRLSTMYGTGEYRARRNRAAKWTKYTRKIDCTECAAIQHETYRPDRRLEQVRSPAVWRRSIPGGPDLLLCYAHEQLWREKDTEDT